MKSTLSRLLALALFCAPSLPLLAQGQSGDLHGPPEDVFAKPPLRIRPFISASPSGYTVTQIRHAYGFDQIAGDGTGQTIAIVDAFGSPTVQADLDTFCATYGIPSTSVKIYYAQSKTGRKDNGWALETSLDVQWAHAIAPGATIALVIAKSNSVSDLLGAVDFASKLGAKQISMSWGAGEFSTESKYDTYFNKSGLTFFASSGDDGAGVIWPAASPYVVAVGGTTLVLDGAGNIGSETAWAGSGGGVSKYLSRPVFQAGWQNATKRGVPDVSYNADPATGFPVYISNYNGASGWITVGGTSAGAPQWAGAMALINATRASSVTNANTLLYALAAADYAGNYRDITAGNNGGYNATASYDFVTGLGSPVGNNLVPALSIAP